jgi:hypothetical protein
MPHSSFHLVSYRQFELIDSYGTKGTDEEEGEEGEEG